MSTIYDKIKFMWDESSLTSYVTPEKVFIAKAKQNKQYPYVLITSVADGRIGSTSDQSFGEETVQVTIFDTNLDRALGNREILHNDVLSEESVLPQPTSPIFLLTEAGSKTQVYIRCSVVS
jgi:hypothetical protein